MDKIVSMTTMIYLYETHKHVMNLTKAALVAILVYFLGLKVQRVYKCIAIAKLDQGLLPLI